MKTAFIYALGNPLTGETRYIGKSNNPQKRYRDHLRQAKKKNTHAARWINGLREQKLRPQLKTLLEVPFLEWPMWEIEIIKAFRSLGVRLTNTAEGGLGGLGISAWTGKKFSPEHCAKISASNTGKIVSPETRAKISVANKISHGTEESKEKKRVLRLGKKHSSESKEKNRLAHLGKVLTPEHIKNRTIAQRGKKRKTNKSGFAGVHWCKMTGQWRASITVNYQDIKLGRFDNLSDAVFVRRLAEDKYFSL